MTYDPQTLVKEYLGELTEITAKRDDLLVSLERTKEKHVKAEDDETRLSYQNAIADHGRQIKLLTNKGNYYMLKIDQLNGIDRTPSTLYDA